MDWVTLLIDFSPTEYRGSKNYKQGCPSSSNLQVHYKTFWKCNKSYRVGKFIGLFYTWLPFSHKTVKPLFPAINQLTATKPLGKIFSAGVWIRKVYVMWTKLDNIFMVMRPQDVTIPSNLFPVARIAPTYTSVLYRNWHNAYQFLFPVGLAI